MNSGGDEYFLVVCVMWVSGLGGVEVSHGSGDVIFFGDECAG